MSEQGFVGIDIGGTTVKLALMTTTGEMKKKWEIPTNLIDHGRYIVSEIVESVQAELKSLVLRGAGVGAPAFIELETGVVTQAVNLGWRDYPLKEVFTEALNVPVFVDNDANLAALGEMWRGAGDGSNEVLFVTLGTGVGGGIITRGQILHGVHGLGGEIGHITVIPDNGAPCNCGKRGCLETVSSAKGMVRLATEQLEAGVDSMLEKEAMTTRHIFEAAEAGDALSLNVVKQSTYYLGLALANLANSLNPEKIVIGGGVSKAREQLLVPLRKVFSQYAIPQVATHTEIKLATLGNDAGIYGAVWLAQASQTKLEVER
ncbi:ROK family glucokinase [Shouchella lonarensis]|uniref:Glucokinase n=1 Tax=Shouchella lonarensis TaxID=1464122 RepID=A0A1G6IU70_9BACI|nr:ROK family glucokinase [Shouchella lonarensis]SDC10004.1 glucokinase [Shouchella lonarensis]